MKADTYSLLTIVPFLPKIQIYNRKREAKYKNSKCNRATHDEILTMFG